MRVEDFDYYLPEELIAQKPADKRDSSRLLVVHRENGTIEHRHFYDILEYLNEGDLMVLNDSRVLPARLYGRKLVRRDSRGIIIAGKGENGGNGAEGENAPGCGKIGEKSIERINKQDAVPGEHDSEHTADSSEISPETYNDRLSNIKLGAKVEFLLMKRIEGDTWETMVRPGKRLKPGDIVIFSGAGDMNPDKPLLMAEILDYSSDGTRIVKFTYDGIFMERLEETGVMPLPPYIERSADEADKDRYQTVYSRENGSVAAPTAGLHFTKELLEKAETKGVDLVYVTLHVGIGTFRPVKVDNIEDHSMHFEEYHIDKYAAARINKAKREGRRIISVGTTSTRTLESAALFDEDAVCADGTKGCWQVRAGYKSTDIFIYPGYEFKIIDSLVTNFHLPKSTLIMLVSALYDREKILDIYKTAVDEKYRFFSYGDAMFIE